MLGGCSGSVLGHSGAHLEVCWAGECVFLVKQFFSERSRGFLVRKWRVRFSEVFEGDAMGKRGKKINFGKVQCFRGQLELR